MTERNMATPKKQFLMLTPKGKGQICVICAKTTISTERLRLFRGSSSNLKKNDVCVRLDSALSICIDQDNDTNVICSQCNKRVITAHNKKSDLVQLYNSTKKYLEGKYVRTKRLQNENFDGQSSKKIAVDPVNKTPSKIPCPVQHQSASMESLAKMPIQYGGSVLKKFASLRGSMGDRNDDLGVEKLKQTPTKIPVPVSVKQSSNKENLPLTQGSRQVSRVSLDLGVQKLKQTPTKIPVSVPKENICLTQGTRQVSRVSLVSLLQPPARPATLTVTHTAESPSKLPVKKKLTTVHVQTESEDVEATESDAWVIVTYKGSGSRKLKVASELVPLVKAVGHISSTVNFPYLAKVILATVHLSDNVFSECCSQVRNEIKALCSTKNPSVLRKTKKEDLQKFSWDIVYSELSERCPHFLQFLETSVCNPTTAINKVKTKEHIKVPTCAVACKLLSIFNDDMSALRHINTVLVKKGGLKKVGFVRLCATYDTMSYITSNRMLENYGQDFDKKVLKWKATVEEDDRRENELEAKLSDLENACLHQPSPHNIFFLEQVKKDLLAFREQMHPGYDLVGDNNDLKLDPRHMSLKNQRKDYHLFNEVCYKNRLGGNTLQNESPKSDIKTTHFGEFLPTDAMLDEVKQESIILIAQIWAKYLPALSWMLKVLPAFIEHNHMKETKSKTERVHLGLLHKNENKLDEMQDIAFFLHQYVPGHSDEQTSTQMPHKITSGGDYLTFERHKRAQELHADGRTPSQRLVGLIPNMELWHFQGELHKVIWIHLFNTKSAKDVGTLYAARNAINARNVTKDPGDNYFAAEALVNKFTEAYLVAGAMEWFGMKDMDDQPSKHCFTDDPLDQSVTNDMKLEFIQAQILQFLGEYFVYPAPTISEHAPVKLHLKCRVCGKQYRKGPKTVRKHELDQHQYPPEDVASTTAVGSSSDGADNILNYTKCSLTLCLLRLNFLNSVKMGDGDRIYRNMQLLYLVFRVSNCYKYAHGCLETLAQVKCLLSDRLSFRLKWNRTVNLTGQADSNYPKDLDVEHNNKLVKNDLHAYRGEITERTINRIGRSIDVTDIIVKNHDRNTGVRRPSGKHTKKDTTGDILCLVKQFAKADLFNNIPGRHHSAFPNMQANVLSSLDIEKMKDWMYNTLRDVADRHFYSYA